MTSEEVARILQFWQSEMIVLASTIDQDRQGSDDEGAMAWRSRVHAHLDKAITQMAYALLYARAPDIGGTLGSALDTLDAQRGKPASPGLYARIIFVLRDHQHLPALPIADLVSRLGQPQQEIESALDRLEEAGVVGRFQGGVFLKGKRKGRA